MLLCAGKQLTKPAQEVLHLGMFAQKSDLVNNGLKSNLLTLLKNNLICERDVNFVVHCTNIHRKGSISLQ